MIPVQLPAHPHGVLNIAITVESDPTGRLFSTAFKPSLPHDEEPMLRKGRDRLEENVKGQKGGDKIVHGINRRFKRGSTSRIL